MAREQDLAVVAVLVAMCMMTVAVAAALNGSGLMNEMRAPIEKIISGFFLR